MTNVDNESAYLIAGSEIEMSVSVAAMILAEVLESNLADVLESKHDEWLCTLN